MEKLAFLSMLSIILQLEKSQKILKILKNIILQIQELYLKPIRHILELTKMGFFLREKLALRVDAIRAFLTKQNTLNLKQRAIKHGLLFQKMQ